MFESRRRHHSCFVWSLNLRAGCLRILGSAQTCTRRGRGIVASLHALSASSDVMLNLIQHPVLSGSTKRMVERKMDSRFRGNDDESRPRHLPIRHPRLVWGSGATGARSSMKSQMPAQGGHDGWRTRERCRHAHPASQRDQEPEGDSPSRRDRAAEPLRGSQGMRRHPARRLRGQTKTKAIPETPSPACRYP